MAFYLLRSFHRYVFIAFVLITTSGICQAGISNQETILCAPTHRPYPTELCSMSTNCRFGGKCRKAAEFSSEGTITRYLNQKDINDERRSSGYGSSYYWPSTRSGSRGAEICTCSFSCGSRRSREQVCGTNGITYRSECHLRRYSCRCQTDVKIQHAGPCDGDNDDAEIDVGIYHERPHAPRVRMPMNSCSELCQFGGRCNDEGQCQCNIHCHSAESFVCGRDGRTYKNSCFLRRAQCEQQKGITIFHDGRCREKGKHRRGVPTCSEYCDGNRNDRVCGSDGVTYLNECLLKRASCKKGGQITVAHRGQCRSQPLALHKLDPCREIYCEYEAVCVPDPIIEFVCSCDAICSEDTTQADNNVRLNIAASPTRDSKWIDISNERPNQARKRRRRKRKNRRNKNRRRNRNRRSIDGSTAPRNVTLCGSDGKTYTNLCEMKTYACHQQTNITVRHVGACLMVLPTPLKQVTLPTPPDIVELPTQDVEQSLHQFSTQRHHHSKAGRNDRHDLQPATLPNNPLSSTAVNPTGRATMRADMTDISNRQEKPELTNRASTTTGRSTLNPTRTTFKTAAVSPSAVDTSQSKRPPKDISQDASEMVSSRDSNLSRLISNRGITERLVAVTKDPVHHDRRKAVIVEYRILQDSSPPTNPVPCEPKSVRPSLKWYQVALISVAAQTLIVALLIGACVLYRRRRQNSKLTDDFGNKTNVIAECPKSEQSATSEKT